MDIICKVPDERADFFLELLRSLGFDGYPKPRRTRKAAVKEMDTTEYLLSSEANAESLRRSIAQIRSGQVVQVEIPD